VVLAGSTLFTNKAFAQTVDVPFSGNIATACSFSTPIAGVLARSTTDPNIINSFENGGINGSVDVTCNSPAQLQVTGIAATNTPAPDPAGTILDSSATTDGGITFTSYNSSTGSSAPIGLNTGPAQIVVVDLFVNRGIAGGTFPAGTYEYEVTLTVTP
jgi:hypothetical protein